MHQSPSQNLYFSIIFIVRHKILSIQDLSWSHSCSPFYLSILFSQWILYWAPRLLEIPGLMVDKVHTSFAFVIFVSLTFPFIHGMVQSHIPNRSQNWPLNFQPLWFWQVVPLPTIWYFLSHIFPNKSSNLSNFSAHAIILSCVSWYLLFRRSGLSLPCTPLALTIVFLLTL